MKTQSAPRMEKLTQVSLCLLTRLSVPTPPLMICRCSILRPQRADSCQSEPQVESRPWGWHASLSQSLALNSAQAFGLATTTRERKRRRKKERRRADCAPAVPGSCQLSAVRSAYLTAWAQGLGAGAGAGACCWLLPSPPHLALGPLGA